MGLLPPPPPSQPLSNCPPARLSLLLCTVTLSRPTSRMCSSHSSVRTLPSGWGPSPWFPFPRPIPAFLTLSSALGPSALLPPPTSLSFPAFGFQVSPFSPCSDLPSCPPHPSLVFLPFLPSLQSSLRVSHPSLLFLTSLSLHADPLHLPPNLPFATSPPMAPFARGRSIRSKCQKTHLCMVSSGCFPPLWDETVAHTEPGDSTQSHPSATQHGRNTYS